MKRQASSSLRCWLAAVRSSFQPAVALQLLGRSQLASLHQPICSLRVHFKWQCDAGSSWLPQKVASVLSVPHLCLQGYRSRLAPTAGTDCPAHSLVPLSSLPFPLQDISEDQQLLARLVHNMQAGGGDTDAQHGMVVAAQVRATSGCVLRYRARKSIMPRSSTFCAPQT